MYNTYVGTVVGTVVAIEEEDGGKAVATIEEDGGNSCNKRSGGWRKLVAKNYVYVVFADLAGYDTYAFISPRLTLQDESCQ